VTHAVQEHSGNVPISKVSEELFLAFGQPPAPVDYAAFAKKLVEVIIQATQQNPARANPRAQMQTRANQIRSLMAQ
jgi:hypothetical protein